MFTDVLGALFPYALVAAWIGVQAGFIAVWHRAHKFHREGMARIARMK